MNDNMKKVLIALRSGEHKQTVKSLQDPNGYCCLGIMCLVFEKETRSKLELRMGDGCFYGGTLDDQEGVQEWVGLKNADGGFIINNSSLADMNDDEGKTFLEIADFIESEPEGLFK